jgi:membrane protease YdiL (CAAX protease family)
MKKWFKNADSQIRSGWKIILAFGLMNIFTGILSIPIILFMFTKFGTNEVSVDVSLDRPLPSLLMMLAQLVGVILTVWIFLKKEKKKWKDVGVTSLRAQGKNLLFGLFLGAASIVLVTLIMWTTKQITLTPAKVHFTNIGIYFISFIFVAANEELFFRGYVISALRQTKSYPLIYIVSCLVFGAAHIPNPHVHLLGIFNVFMIGLLFAYMLIQTKSLWMSAGYHLTWNFFQGNILGFNVSGTAGDGFFHIKGAENIWTGGSFGAEASIWTTAVILLGLFLTKKFTRVDGGSNIGIRKNL